MTGNSFRLGNRPPRRPRLRPPRFWIRPPQTIEERVLELALRPLSGFYRIGLFLDQARRRRRLRALPVPVISVGNLVVGGTGKTPLTLWLADCLLRNGWRPVILSRGYGRSGERVERVPTGLKASGSWRQYGDEPVLMAAKCPGASVWVGRDRVHSGLEAIRQDGADVLLLDDGFQYLGLKRDLDLVLLDAFRPFGNGRLLPSGPLREPVSHLRRADAFLLTGPGSASSASSAQAMLRRRFSDQPVFHCRKRIGRFTVGINGSVVPVRHLRGRPVVAFAGLARPESFFADLAAAGLEIGRTLVFPDHHAYGPADMGPILAAVRAERAAFLITTEKDWVRLPPWLREGVVSAALEITFDDQEPAFADFVVEQISRCRGAEGTSERLDRDH